MSPPPEIFDEWNEQKKTIHQNSRKIVFHEGEIWWCSLGVNIGEKTYGKGKYFRRPVLIIRKLSGHTAVVLPLSTKQKKGSWYYSMNTPDMPRIALLHQIRMIDIQRLESRVLTLSVGDIADIKKAVAKFYSP